MTFIAIIVIIGIAAFVALAVIKGAWSDRRSVERYHDTLRHLHQAAEGGSRAGGPGVRIAPRSQPYVRILADMSVTGRVEAQPPEVELPPEEVTPRTQPATVVPAPVEPVAVPAPVEPVVVTAPVEPVAVTAPVEPVVVTAPVEPVVVAEESPLAVAPIALGAGESPVLPRVARSHRAPRRPRRLWVTSGVAAVCAALIAVSAVVLATGGGTPSPYHRSGVARASATVPATTVPVTPSTVAPPPPVAVVSTSSGTGQATYTVKSTHITMAIIATARSWIELRSGSQAGQLLYTGFVVSGDQRNFSIPSGAWLRLGFPAGVAVTVDGQKLGIPQSNSPFDLSVVPA